MAQPAPCAPDLGLRVILNPLKNEAHWIGTRPELEAEGLIPFDTTWPEDGKRAWWRADDTHYTLRRKAGGDLWKLTTWRSDGNFRHRCIKAKAEELAALIEPSSPQKRAAWERHWKAQQDDRFQAFKRALLGQKRWGRKPMQAANIDQGVRP